MGFWPWYKKEIKKILISQLDRLVEPLKKALAPIKEILTGCYNDLANPIFEDVVAIIGLITVLSVALCVLSGVLPLIYGVYSLLASLIYITLLAHGVYRELHPPNISSATINNSD